MKRLGLTLVAAVCLTAGAFAAGNQPTTAKWEGNINVNKLGKYLNLSANQQEEVTNICDYFNEQMSRAASSKKSQEKLVRNAVYGNLKLMKKTLMPVLAGDTPDELAARVLKQEHILYPRAVRLVAEGRVRLENGRTIMDRGASQELAILG